MYSAYYGLIPQPICDLRRRDGFNLPKYKYSIRRTSLSYGGLFVWNILPESYKLSDSDASFKKKKKRPGTTT